MPVTANRGRAPLRLTMLPERLGGHDVREHFQAIIIAGLIAGVIGGAWTWVNRYEIKPHESGSFKLRDRLTGQVKLCAMIDDKKTYKTYCGAELQRRKDQMRQENAAEVSPAF